MASISEDEIYNLPYTGQEVDNMIKFCTTSIADQFSTSSTYNIDDFVIYDGLLYQCITAVTTAGAWDSTKWQVQKMFDNSGYVIIQSGTSESNI